MTRATRSFTPAVRAMLWPLALMCILTHSACLCKRLLRRTFETAVQQETDFAGTWLAMHSNNHIIIATIHSPCQREEVKLFKRILSLMVLTAIVRWQHNTALKASRGMGGTGEWLFVFTNNQQTTKHKQGTDIQGQEPFQWHSAVRGWPSELSPQPTYLSGKTERKSVLYMSF